MGGEQRRPVRPRDRRSPACTLRRMRTGWLLALLAISCSHPAKEPAPAAPGPSPSPAPSPAPAPSPPPAPAPAPPAAPANISRIIISATTRPSGLLVTTTAPDGTITSRLSVLENGRGPKVDATIRIAADGTIASLAATGHHTFGAKVD